MRVPIKFKKKFRYVLIYKKDKKPAFNEIVHFFEKLFGTISKKKAILSLVRQREDIELIKINKMYIPQFFIAILYYKKKRGRRIRILRVSGTIKSIFKKEKILK